jgi:hypothetical protein
VIGGSRFLSAATVILRTDALTVERVLKVLE